MRRIGISPHSTGFHAQASVAARRRGATPIPIRHLLTAAPILLLAAQSRACYNDRDTEIRERVSPPEVLRALTGAFVRYPAAYYEARVARLRAKPKLTDPELDDLAVALGRLGREEEGLRALARKRGETKEARYRLRANRGTLLAHLALRRGGDPAFLKRAVEDIAEAIRIKPAAHFGREGVQLEVLRWAQGVVRNPAHGSAGPETLGRHLEASDAKANEATVRGLAGLIELGGAWESPDVVAAIGRLAPEVDEDFENDTASLQHLHLGRAGVYARLRFAELRSFGRPPLHNDAESDLEFTDLTPKGEAPVYRTRIATMERDYERARIAAEAATKARDAYLAKGLAEGRHPDTAPDFWRGWTEPKPPTVTTLAPHRIANPNRGRTRRTITAALALAAGVAALFLALVALMIVRLLRRRFKARR